MAKNHAFLTLATLSALASVAAANGPAPKPSLYERIGGIHKIAALVYRSVELMTKDPVLMKNPRLAAMLTPQGIPGIQFTQTAYVAKSFGGPQVYMGPGTPDFLSYVKFNAKEMAAKKATIMQSLKEHKVPMNLQREVLSWFEMQVKRKPMKAWQPMPETFAKPEGLYARLGGSMAIAAVVDDFINRLATDPTIGANPHVAKSLTSGKVSAAGLKYLVSEQLASAAGGPYKYSGRTMADSHKGLMITGQEWDTSVKLLMQTFDKFNVPERERQEVIAVIASTRGDIVGK